MEGWRGSRESVMGVVCRWQRRVGVLVFAVVVVMMMMGSVGVKCNTVEKAGELVWTRKGVGVVSRFARSPQQGASSSGGGGGGTKRRVAVASDDGVIAVLALRTGEATWRHDLGVTSVDAPGSLSPAHARANPGVLEEVLMTKKLAVSVVTHDEGNARGSIALRAFSQQSGTLAWQRQIECSHLQHGNDSNLLAKRLVRGRTDKGKSSSSSSSGGGGGGGGGGSKTRLGGRVAATYVAESASADGGSFKEGIAIACGDAITMLNTTDGSSLWAFEPDVVAKNAKEDEGVSRLSAMSARPSSGQLAVATLTPDGNAVTVRVFGVDDGTLASSWKLPLRSGDDVHSLMLGGDAAAGWRLVAVAATAHNGVNTGYAESFELLAPVADDGVGTVGTSLSIDNVGTAALSTDGSVLAVVAPDGETGARIVKLASGDVTFTSAIATVVSALDESGDKIAVSGASDEDGKIFFLVIEGATGTTIHEERNTVSVDEQGFPTALSVSTYTRNSKNANVAGDAGVGFRALVCFEGGSIALLQQELVVWIREEALAAVTDASFVELPRKALALRYAAGSTSSASEAQDLMPSSGGSIVDALTMQLLGFKAQFKLASDAEVKQLVQLRRDASGRSKLSRDANGFRKLIVLGTRTSRVLGVHGGDGRIVWSTHVPSLASTLQILPWSPAPGSNDSPQLLIIGKSTTSNETVLVWIRAHCGTIIDMKYLPFSVRHVASLPRGASDKAKPPAYLVIDQDMGVHALFDDTEEEGLDALDASATQGTYIFDVDAETGVLRGFNLHKSATGGSRFVARETWRQSLGFGAATSLRLISVVRQNPNDVTYSRSRVLGDRSFRLKYLNRNLAFLAFETSQGEGGVATSYAPSLTVMLIDTVSGNVLHSLVHDAARGPVSAVLCENWVVYHFWNEKATRFEVSSLELFAEAGPGEDFSVQSMLMKAVMPAATNETVTSSFAQPAVTVLSQSFFLSASLTGMTTSVTHSGITSKMLLLSTTSNQVRVPLSHSCYAPHPPSTFSSRGV